MTKADIADYLHEQTGLPLNEAAYCVEAILEAMKDTLAQGEDVKVPGFGTFHVRKKRTRVGRNPKTGEETEIPPHTVVTFTASEQLKVKVER
jgi:integration host factor subunit alpha